ncbi:MAG TPA: ECF-type sigma factor [Pyrinomonadaceae bacterium]|nr:ECF-type sigma factor [Pyrinomonadaceae bacterium]
MDDDAPHEVTRLLAAWSHGDKAALDRLAPLVYDELRRLARRRMRREQPGHTLQTTALVNEAYIKLAGQRGMEWESRKHFFAVAARVMRQILIDHARSRRRRKRGGGGRAVQPDDAGAMTLEHAADLLWQGAPVMTPERAADLLALDSALADLETHDPEKGRVVELHHFLGLTFDEVADVLGISSRTAKRHWESAKAWLYHAVSKGDTTEA